MENQLIDLKIKNEELIKENIALTPAAFTLSL